MGRFDQIGRSPRKLKTDIELCWRVVVHCGGVQFIYDTVRKSFYKIYKSPGYTVAMEKISVYDVAREIKEIVEDNFSYELKLHPKIQELLQRPKIYAAHVLQTVEQLTGEQSCA